MATYHEKLVGVTRDGRQTLIAQMRAGAPVRVVRDATNRFDVNAIDVHTQSGQSLGFISRERAAKLAPMLDRVGGSVPGRVISILGGGNYNYGIVIELAVNETVTPTVSAPLSSSSITDKVVLSVDVALKPTPQLVALFKLLIRFDMTMSRDARRLRAFLSDLAPDEPKLLLRALVDAGASGIAQRFEEDGIPATERAKNAQTRLLFETYGLRADIAKWVVDMWAAALEFRAEKMSVEPNYWWVSPHTSDKSADESTSLTLSVNKGVDAPKKLRDNIAKTRPTSSQRKSVADLVWDGGIESSPTPVGAPSIASTLITEHEASSDGRIEPFGDGAISQSSAHSDGIALVENNGSIYTKHQVVEGYITTHTKQQMVVQLSSGARAVVRERELNALSDAQRKKLRPGNYVCAHVLEPVDAKGLIVLSLSKALEDAAWKRVERMFLAREIVEANIHKQDKSGLIVEIENLHGYIPLSDLSNINQKMFDLNICVIGLKLQVVVTNVDRSKNILICSETQAELEIDAAQVVKNHLKQKSGVNTEEHRHQIRSQAPNHNSLNNGTKNSLLLGLTTGQVVDAIVSSVQYKEIYVNIENTICLIDNSEISHRRFDHPSEIVKPGQSIKVKVLKVDRDNGKIDLSIKAMQTDPWLNLTARYRIGQNVDVEVVRISNKRGVLVRMKNDSDIEGELRADELVDAGFKRPRDILREGQNLKACIVEIDVHRRWLIFALRSMDGNIGD
jgi:small subunit ribosomal protein S1